MFQADIVGTVIAGRIDMEIEGSRVSCSVPDVFRIAETRGLLNGIERIISIGIGPKI